MDFIELTNEQDESISLNTKDISYIKDNGSGSYISLRSGGSLIVKEDGFTLFKLINKIES